MSKKRTVSAFEKAVLATSDIANAYKPGLTALVGDHSRKIVVKDTSKLQGSVDIDKATASIYPNSSRWDYGLSYNNKVYFVEVHTANSREVQAVIKKLIWLKDWLVHKAPEINKLKSSSPFYWVQSSGFDIPKNTRQYRMAVQNSLLPVRHLKLD